MVVDHLREGMMPFCLSDIIGKCSIKKKFPKKLKKEGGDFQGIHFNLSSLSLTFSMMQTSERETAFILSSLQKAVSKCTESKDIVAQEKKA